MSFVRGRCCANRGSGALVFRRSFFASAIAAAEGCETAAEPARPDAPRARQAVYFRNRRFLEVMTMKKFALLLLLAVPLFAQTNAKKPPTTLRGVLLEQLHQSHDQEDWYVPVSIAVDGLTAEQAMWSPGKGNHSVGQLAYHIWYWDQRALNDFNGVKNEKFDGNN